MEDAKIVQREIGTEKGSLGAQAMSIAQKNELQEVLKDPQVDDISSSQYVQSRESSDYKSSNTCGTRVR